MLRFLFTVALSAFLTAGFLVFNPSDHAHDLLERLDLLDTLRDSYAIVPPPPPQPVNPYAARFSPADAANRKDQEDHLSRTIRLLEEENQALVERQKTYSARRGVSDIPSGDARAIQRQIDANKARILDLKQQQNKL